ncbi:MAG: electron transfer flavoprotein subunit beta/FixA family protein [candidate division Zixibacteria bacterium]|nr:electron transfer flavoprotein subunit beta/FixA family protein [candidate division Zixibacteria bacterium]MDH3938484.1 electron transfer flavoprotein subunit beta/FixA family protein [candidate division Zixibacteria bacterium]MDH4033559.1 electron transfer flavoprotein subunit beta/FixA family protein [candidate division Zixibacteria bacterium]
MNIVVLIKQVPEIALIKVDEAANEVVLPQGPGMVNPFDEYAVEEALRIKEQSGGTVSVISVGSERTDSALRACLALGVDEAYLLCDDSFVGSDPQAAGRILAAGLKKLDGVDLILAGKQAIDSDAAQVPTVVAALLDLPQAMFVRKFESVESGSATVQRTTEEGYDLIQLSLPAVVSVVKEINEPRLPSLKGKMAAKKKTITTWTAADLEIDSGGVGEASLTKTIKVSVPPPRPSGEMVEGETPEEIAGKLFDKLRDKQVL